MKEILRKRFLENMQRHPDIDWQEVEAHLNEENLAILEQMEKTGGEPDVILRSESGFIYADCSPESPAGRRSLCYDEKARLSRKKNAPEGSAERQASQMGVELMDEQMYRYLQILGEFDRKTSSWIETPEFFRKQGGALFAERRYSTVFVYHNGADSYYGVRGWRGILRI